MSLYQEMWAHVANRFPVNPAEADPVLQCALRFLCERIECMEQDVRQERRFRAACAALQGYRMSPNFDHADGSFDKTIAEWCVSDADNLLAALGKPKEPDHG